MSQIKQIYRLAQQGASIKSISRSLSISRNTVRKYLASQRESGRSFAQLLALEDHALSELLLGGETSAAPTAGRQQRLEARREHLLAELPRKGVTRWLLWAEYRQQDPDGYSYSQFCWHLAQWQKADRVTMAGLSHQPGEQMYMDFAGLQAEYIDPADGSLRKAPVLVTTLGYSQYSSVEALPSQGGEDLIRGLESAGRFFGGVCAQLIPDNLKAAVSVADRYAPKLSQLMADFAEHYQMVVLPARPRRPRDKSLVESAVRDVERHVMAPLRHRTFRSLAELNEAYRQQLALWHDRPFQGRSESRRERFEGTERAALRPLPPTPFETKKYVTLTVGTHYHVRLGEDKHYYSVPWRYAARKVQLIYTPARVQIFAGNELIATHLRDRTPHAYSTDPDHMPPGHARWAGRSPEDYRRRAEAISAEVGRLVEQLLAADPCTERALRSCEGVLGLARKAGPDQLTAAAVVALELGCCTYSFVHRMIQNGMARPKAGPAGALPELPAHDNIRGPKYFLPTNT